MGEIPSISRILRRAIQANGIASASGTKPFANTATPSNADAKISALSGRFEQSLQKDKDWVAANQAVEQKKAGLIAANYAVSAALKQEEQSVMSKR